MNICFFRRRRAVAVLSAFFCVLIGAVYWLSRPSPVERLQPYLGQDLRTLSEDEQIEVDSLIGQFAPDAKMCRRPPPPQSWDPRDWFNHFSSRPTAAVLFHRSWYVWQVKNEQGHDRLVLFQGQPLVMIPGSSSARVFVFDAAGNSLTRCVFKAGYRITIEDARWLNDSGHGFPCLLVYSLPSINGGDVTCQYYAFLEDSFALVRLEDSVGKFVPVNYEHPHCTIGPAPPERTPQLWEAALRSSNLAEVLRSLVWLGGDHFDPPLRASGFSVESFEDATRVLATRARPGVRSAVEALTHSSDCWVREAAQHAWEIMEKRNR